MKESKPNEAPEPKAETTVGKEILLAQLEAEERKIDSEFVKAYGELCEKYKRTLKAKLVILEGQPPMFETMLMRT